MKKAIRISVFLLCVFYLTGCASYRAVALPTPEFLLNPSEGSGNLSVAAKAFTEEDCRTYLGRRSIYKGYRPVQLVIRNNTDKAYDFSLSRMSLSYCTPSEVAKNVHASAGVNAIGIGSAGFVLGVPLTVPLAIFSAVSISSIVPLAIPFIPAIISAQIAKDKVSHANENLDQDYDAKGAKDQILEPHTSINAVVFVPKKEYTSNFTVSLIDLETKKPVVLNISAN